MSLTNKWASKTICGVLIVTMAVQVFSLSGPNVCMVQQKYNITKRVKYRAPMSIRTYEWCFSMPPRCSKWSTEMKDLTRLETEERTAEVAVCCPGYKMKDVACVPICPLGKTGQGCTEDCPTNKWGPNCVNECSECINGYCLPTTGECDCEDGWQGESCTVSMPTTQPPPALMEELLTTTKSSVRTVPSTLSTIPFTKTVPFTPPPLPPSTRLASETSTQMTSSTTDKTEKITMQTHLNTTTSSYYISNSSYTTLTPLWIDTNIRNSLPNTTKLNYVYNRTETSIEGTSVKNVSKHDSSLEMTIPLTTKPRDIPFQLNSNIRSETINTMPFTPTITFSTSTTAVPMTAFNSTVTPKATDSLFINISMTSTSKASSLPVKTSSSVLTPSSLNLPATSKVSTLVLRVNESVNSFKLDNNNSSTTPVILTVPSQPLFFNTTIEISNRKAVSTLITTSIPLTNTTINSTQIPVTVILSPSNLAPTSPTPASSTISMKPSTPTSKIATVVDRETTEKYATVEYTKRPDTNNKMYSTTTKFKPKEIWIRPTQKGDSSFENKYKNIYDTYTKQKTVTNQNEAVSENTTPKTIIVSIIPTSVSHATFKKIALTTASYVYLQKNITYKPTGKSDQGFTKSMTSQVSTAVPFTIKILPTSNLYVKSLGTPKSTTTLSRETTRMLNLTSKKAPLHTTVPEKQTFKILNSTIATSRTTNSMSTLNEVKILNSSTFTTKPLTNKDKMKSHKLTTIPNKKINTSVLENDNFNKEKANVTLSKSKLQETAIRILTEKANSKNVSKTPNKVTTQEPEDETFHILTEPEHITAVMSENDRDRTSMDLISVISIAGGVMITVITVAIVIVMIERCKRPRYENVNKMNDIRMQVIIDNNDVPPPYVRSIFHSPLPGILECHYDHLPRRHDFGTMPVRIPVRSDERRPLSVSDCTIEALKCEAKLDVIDSTTAEPLYAEIPCWRPPSEHAIAVVNLNGEAITEL